MTKTEAKKAQPTCLIVDDEADYLLMLERTLKDLGVASLKAGTVNEALKLIATEDFTLCITDMWLPDTRGGKRRQTGGMDVISQVRQEKPKIPIIAITSVATLETTVQVLKLGAFDYIFRPTTVVTLRHVISNALRFSENIQQENAEKREYIANNLLGNSKVMRELRSQLETFAYKQAPVYIKGETGTGKEVVARAIHRLSSRADKPFVAVNCGAIPTDLVESQFFGHKKGSFSGATQDKIGLFQAAEGGVLFLDEIGDFPFPIQAKLLRAIQEKKVCPVGSNQEIPVDVRILSATHQDLDELVRLGSFRADLLYRIKVVELHVPPLRERIEDIPILSAKILEHFSADMSPPYRLHPEALALLQSHPFYGNVRELQNILERATMVCQSSEILCTDLQLPGSTNDSGLETSLNNLKTTVSEITAEESKEESKNTEELANDELSNSDSEDEILNSPNITLTSELEAERAKIIAALKQTGHNLSLTAKSLNVSRSTLRYRITRIKKAIIIAAAAKSLNMTTATLREQIALLWGDESPKLKRKIEKIR